MSEAEKDYLPATVHDWALPLYDPFVKLIGVDAARRALIDQAALRLDQRILDIGCGTGTLALLIKRLYPKVEIVGLDPDPKALASAGRKARRAAVSIRFDRGFADRLPYADASFDRVFSSFMFHHVPAEDREKMFRETARVLKPGGSLHLMDFRRQETGAMGWFARLFHSVEVLKDNSEQRVIGLMSQAGLADAEKVMDGAIFFGSVSIAYYRARV